MIEIKLSNLNPSLIEQLQKLASNNNHTLEEEIKNILAEKLQNTNQFELTRERENLTKDKRTAQERANAWKETFVSIITFIHPDDKPQFPLESLSPSKGMKRESLGFL